MNLKMTCHDKCRQLQKSQLTSTFSFVALVVRLEMVLKLHYKTTIRAYAPVCISNLKEKEQVHLYWKGNVSF